MGGVGDGSMSSPPKIEYLPATENDDGSVGVDISNLSSSENPDIVSASVNFVARYYLSKNKELRVKVPEEYFSFIAPLRQMGFDKIERAESTYIVLTEDKSLQIASGVTSMQRGNIANSGNPSNLICSQTSEANLVVQTPSETACEQGPEFQQSSQTFPSGPAGMGIDNEASGLQGFFAGPEIPECGVQTKKRPHATHEFELPSTRPRGPDFEDKEKGLVLQLKLEYLQNPANEGKGHKWSTFVSDNMRKNGYDREPKAVRGQWDTFKKSRDALMRKFPQGTGYWDMTMDEKKAYRKDRDRHFPLTFEPEWVVAMENIEKMEPRRAAKKQTRRDGQEGVFSQSLASTITGSTNFAGAGSSDANIQASVQHPGQASARGSDEGLLVNLQGPGAPPSFIQDYLSFSHSLREKDYQEMSVMIHEQLAVQREDVQLTVSASKKLMESSSSDSLENSVDALVQSFLS